MIELCGEKKNNSRFLFFAYDIIVNLFRIFYGKFTIIGTKFTIQKYLIKFTISFANLKENFKIFLLFIKKFWMIELCGKKK